VVLPVAADLPDPLAVLEPIARTLREAEVGSIDLISSMPLNLPLPDATWHVHDPDDRAGIAYLATTEEGRRVYLGRLLTDADLVIPVGTLGYDPALGYRGPWSVVFPGSSDRETIARYQNLTSDEPAARDRPTLALRESAEVSWLLGCQLQVGVVPGVDGVLRVFAGVESVLRGKALEALDAAWTFTVEERAELVVAGVGAPGRPTSLETLAAGIATATRLVRRGGKIVVLSRAQGELGPALRALRGLDDPRVGLARLRGHETDADFATARQLAASLAWADVYLHSALEAGEVEDLGMVPLERPAEARKLVASAHSVTVLSQADRTRAQVAGEP
jgi:hypothetical protein